MQVYCKPFCDRHTRVPFHNVKKRFRRSLNPIATLIAQSPRLSFSLIAPVFLFYPQFFLSSPSAPYSAAFPRACSALSALPSLRAARRF